MSLHAHDAGGTPTVVKFCRMKGCRPITQKDAPCSRCGTWQGYPPDQQIPACLRWAYRPEVISKLFTFDQDPLFRLMEKNGDWGTRWIRSYV